VLCPKERRRVGEARQKTTNRRGHERFGVRHNERCDVNDQRREAKRNVVCYCENVWAFGANIRLRSWNR